MPSVRITRRIVDPITFCERVGLEFVPRGIEDFILDETIGMAYTLPRHKPRLEQQQHHQPPPSPLPESSVLTTLEHQHHPPAPPSPVPDSSVVIPALQQSPDEKESPERELEESSSSESSSSGSSSSESSSSESSSAGSSSSEASSSEDEDVPINRVVRPPSPPIPPSPTGKSPRKSPRKSSLISPSPRRTMKVSLKNLQKTSLLQIMERFPTTPDLSMDEASMNSDEYLGGVQQPLDDGKKHVRFADEIDVKQYSKSGASVFDDLFYASHDLAEFRYEAFMEEAGLDMAEYD